jgi:IclR family acetate operon transcriptional repressor
MAARNHIELVEKTLRVLEVLAESDDGNALKDIASRLKLVKSSVFRILYTLKEIGYVEQVGENGTYRSSLQMLTLTRKSAVASSLTIIAWLYLVQLRDDLWESAWLGELSRREVVLIAVAEGLRRLHLSLEVGDRCPLHATAVGKAIAAYMSRPELEAALGPGELARFTRHTLTSRAQLHMELARVRSDGFSINDEETIEGAVLFSAPIDSLGKAFAAVSVSAPLGRCPTARRKTLSQAVKRTCAAISKDLRRVEFTWQELSRG